MRTIPTNNFGCVQSNVDEGTSDNIRVPSPMMASKLREEAEYYGRQRVPSRSKAAEFKGCQILAGSKGAEGTRDHRSTLPKGCVGYRISSYCAIRCSYGSKEGILSAPAKPAGRGYCFRFLAGTRETFIGESSHSVSRVTCHQNHGGARLAARQAKGASRSIRA